MVDRLRRAGIDVANADDFPEAGEEGAGAPGSPPGAKPPGAGGGQLSDAEKAAQAAANRARMQQANQKK